MTHFYAHNPTYAPGSINRQLAAYKEFAKTHVAIADQYPLSSGAGYIITTKMFDLFKLNGEGVAGVERVFAELEREMPDVAGVQYLRAVFYVRSMGWEPAAERSTFYRKAIETLRRLQRQGTGLYHRKALATLASLYFSEGDYRNARDHFRMYLNAYAGTAWAWVAALRVGQSNEALGDRRAAVDAHLTAASKYASVPFARVLGRAYAARGYEAQGQFSAALREYQAALTGWDTDYGPTYSLHIGFWSRFFPAERQFGGVSENGRILFETYPIITELEFLNAERTKAAARVVVGHEGGTIVLEKRQGVWMAWRLSTPGLRKFRSGRTCPAAASLHPKRDERVHMKRNQRHGLRS